MFLDALGVRLFTAHGASSYTVGKIQQYQLTSSHYMSTGSFVRELTLNIDNLTFQYATSVEFKPDGTRMYVSGLTNSGNKVAQYDLSTAWDISTASLDIAISMPAISSVRLQDTGEHMFILDTADPDTLKKYNMVTYGTLEQCSHYQYRHKILQ